MNRWRFTNRNPRFKAKVRPRLDGTPTCLRERKESYPISSDERKKERWEEGGGQSLCIIKTGDDVAECEVPWYVEKGLGIPRAREHFEKCNPPPCSPLGHEAVPFDLFNPRSRNSSNKPETPTRSNTFCFAAEGEKTTTSRRIGCWLRAIWNCSLRAIGFSFHSCFLFFHFFPAFGYLEWRVDFVAGTGGGRRGHGGIKARGFNEEWRWMSRELRDGFTSVNLNASCGERAKD